MKNTHLNNLDKIYNDWIKNTKFGFPIENTKENGNWLDIEEFDFTYRNQLIPRHLEFLQSLLNVTVEIQNHEQMPLNTWSNNE